MADKKININSIKKIPSFGTNNPSIKFDYCESCGKEKDVGRSFYKSKNPTLNGYTLFCKDCIKKRIYRSDNKIDKQEMKKVLKEMDLPWFDETYQNALKSDSETFGVYIRLLNTVSKSKGKKYLVWEDGETQEKEQEKKDNKIINNQNEEVNISDEDMIKLQNFWGKGYDNGQYIELQNFYDEFASEYETDLPAQRLNFKNAAKTQLQADEALIRNEVDLYNKLMVTLSKILGDSNVKPVQATGAEANDQITFGVLIKKYENEKPIYEKLDDEMKIYIDTLMVGHLAKMEGLNNELVDKYDKALEEYSIDFEKERSTGDD